MSAVVRDRDALLAALAGLRGQPGTPAVRLAIAEAEFRLALDPGTDRAEAIGRLRAALAQDPFLPKLNLHLGRLLHLGGRHRDAIAQYRQALRLAPASRRAHLLLASALLELGKAERELGQALLAALNSGDPEGLAPVVAAVDRLSREQETAAKPEAKKGRAAKARPPRHTAPDTWQVSLVEQLVREKPLRAQVNAHLAAGAADVAESAVACVLLLVSGDSPRDVRASAPKAPGHPALTLLEDALRLAEAPTAAEFVELATALLAAGALPVELVCWLHFDRFGPGSGLPPVEVVRALDRYPDGDCENELRLAVYDGLARAAWADGRLTEARVLWLSAARLDPHRVPIAVNQALLAARAKSVDEYGPAWDRLTELLYLHPAGTGELGLLLDERRTLHLALSQQSRLRHCAPTSSPYPSEAELRAWMDDEDALEVWLREWDLYYLNARLGFRSPAILLGVAPDAIPEHLDAAVEAFERSADSALRDADWAGAAVFRSLVTDRVAQARAAVAERAEDVYHDLEKPRADRLTDEALRRGLLLRSMIRVLIERGSSAGVEPGVRMARRQLALPWFMITPVCVERGLLDADADPVGIFEGDLLRLAGQWDEPAPTGPQQWRARLDALAECVALAPDRLEPRVLHCRALAAAEQPDAAYASAVEALDRPVADPDEDTAALRSMLVSVVGEVALGAVPAHLRKPDTPEAVERTVAACRAALRRYPRAGVLHRSIAGLLLDLGGEGRAAEAVAQLVTAIESALDDEDRVASETQLARTRGAAAEAAVRAKVKDLTQPAIDRVAEAIDEIGRDPGPEAVAAARTAVRAAVTAVEEAVAMAEQAGMTAEATWLRERLERLRQTESKLPEDEG